MTNDSVTDFSILINACANLKKEITKVTDLWYEFYRNHECPTRSDHLFLEQIGYLGNDLESYLEVLLKKQPIST